MLQFNAGNIRRLRLAIRRCSNTVTNVLERKPYGNGRSDSKDARSAAYDFASASVLAAPHVADD